MALYIWPLYIFTKCIVLYMLFWSSTDYLLLHTVYVADTELRWISLTTFPNRRTTWLLIPSDCPQVGYHLFRCHTRNNYNRHDCCVTAREIAEVWGRPRLRRWYNYRFPGQGHRNFPLPLLPLDYFHRGARACVRPLTGPVRLIPPLSREIASFGAKPIRRTSGSTAHSIQLPFLCDYLNLKFWLPSLCRLTYHVIVPRIISTTLNRDKVIRFWSILLFQHPL